MQEYYYISKPSELNGVVLLHAAGCKSLPDINNRIFLGTFYHPLDAMKIAKFKDPDARPCRECLYALRKT